MKHVLLILLASVLVAQDKGEKELDDHGRDEERYERDFDDFDDGGKRSDLMEMMMVTSGCLNLIPREILWILC